MKNKNSFGEIIQSNLTSWEFQSWKWNYSLLFSDIVYTIINNITIFGIITHIETKSMYETREVHPFQMTQDELLKEHPHIFELLKTTGICMTLGYQNATDIFHYTIPPHPPLIHTFVHHASQKQIISFFNDANAFNLLFSSSDKNFILQEAIFSLFIRLQNNKVLTKNHITHLIDAIIQHGYMDYQKLQLFIQRIEKTAQL